MRTATFIFVFVFLSIGFVNAQTGTSREDKRENIQAERIQDGIHRGELTHRETRLLAREQRHIKRAEKRMKSDGKVTRREKRWLENKQDRASRHIGRTRNNVVDKY